MMVKNGFYASVSWQLVTTHDNDDDDDKNDGAD